MVFLGVIFNSLGRAYVWKKTESTPLPWARWFKTQAFILYTHWSIFNHIMLDCLFNQLCKSLPFSSFRALISNSRHVIQDIKNKNNNFIANTLKNMHAKFQLNPCSSFRGEDFWKSLRTTDDRRRRTQSDDKSSHCLRQGELKMHKVVLVN